MPFEASKTKFTVFWLNHELYNLINSALKWRGTWGGPEHRITAGKVHETPSLQQLFLAT